MEIYNDILDAIKTESLDGEAKPTRIQHHSNLSYDKMSKYLKELEAKKMISTSPIKITERGEKFLSDYVKIDEFLSEMQVKYLEDTNEE